MNKIEKKLLKITYPDLDITALEEVIDATGNPTVAVMVLCGLYEMPAMPATVTKNEIKLLFISYDKWTDTVQYVYDQNKHIYRFFPAGTLKENINKDNYEQLCCNYTDDCVSFRVELEDVIAKKSSMPLTEWLKYHDAHKFTDKKISELLSM